RGGARLQQAHDLLASLLPAPRHRHGVRDWRAHVYLGSWSRCDRIRGRCRRCRRMPRRRGGPVMRGAMMKVRVLLRIALFVVWLAVIRISAVDHWGTLWTIAATAVAAFLMGVPLAPRRWIRQRRDRRLARHH